jgi:hypothetical protein
MAGFFDLTDPDNAALLGLASGLLQAGAPSRLPVPLGAALGRGLQDAINVELGRRLAQATALSRRGLSGVPPLASFGRALGSRRVTP